MQLRRTSTSANPTKMQHRRNASCFQDKQEVPTAPDLEEFIQYMLKKQQEFAILAVQIKQLEAQNSALREKLEQKRSFEREMEGEYSRMQHKNNALRLKIENQERAIHEQIQAHNQQIESLSSLISKRTRLADKLFCLKQAYRRETTTSEDQRLMQQKQKQITQLQESSAEFHHKIQMLESQLVQFKQGKQRVAELRAKRDIDRKMLASSNLIVEQMLKDKSKGELREHVLTDPSFLIMRKGVKNKMDIIRLGLQAHIEVNSFRTALTQEKDFGGVELIYEPPGREEQEMMKTQEYLIYERIMGSCKEFSAMMIDEMEETLRIKENNKKKEIESIRKKSTLAIEQGRRLDGEIKKRDTVIDELRQKLLNIKV